MGVRGPPPALDDDPQGDGDRERERKGKTALARVVADRLGAPFVELDALVHGPNWVELSGDELRERLQPVLAGGRWV